MDRNFRKGSLEVDFARQPFDSPLRLLADSTRIFFTNLPLLAALTLAVFLPGELLLQFAGYLLNVPAEGILSYFLMDLGDLFLGALVIPAVMYALLEQFRNGRTAPFAESLRWGRRQWGRMAWNKFKVEITIALWTLLLFVPGLVAMVKLALVDPVVAIEGDGESQPLERSTRLTEGRRWKVFFVLLPLTIVDLVGSFFVLSALRGMSHSRVALAAADSALAVVSQWTTVAALLLYLGMAPVAATAEAPGKRSGGSEPTRPRRRTKQ